MIFIVFYIKRVYLNIQIHSFFKDSNTHSQCVLINYHLQIYTHYPFSSRYVACYVSTEGAVRYKKTDTQWMSA